MLSNHNGQSGSDSSGLNQVPIYSNDPPVLESLQRLRENEIARAFAFLEANYAEFTTRFSFLDRHHPIVLNFRLQTSILCRFLPEGVDLGLACGLNDIGKAFCFRLQ
jgi:hypothetical protein